MSSMRHNPFSHTVHRIKAGVSEHLSCSGIEAPSSLNEIFSDGCVWISVQYFYNLH